MGLIRDEKLSDSLNAKGFAAGGNEFHIFQTAPDNSYFRQRINDNHRFLIFA